MCHCATFPSLSWMQLIAKSLLYLLEDSSAIDPAKTVWPEAEDPTEVL